MALSSADILRGPRRPFGRRGPVDVLLERAFPGFFERGDLAAAQVAAQTGMSLEDLVAFAGVTSPLGQMRNLERVRRAIEGMGGETRISQLAEVPRYVQGAGRMALERVDPERFFVEFLRGRLGSATAEQLARPGRVVAPGSFPEHLALAMSRGRDVAGNIRAPTIVQDVPSQILNALRLVFGQRTPAEYVRRKAGVPR